MNQYKRHHLHAACIVLTILLSQAYCFAAEATTRPSLQVPAGTPRVDASPNDPAWESSGLIPELADPISTKAQPTQFPTQIRILWDPNFLYIRFINHGPEIVAPYEKDHEQLYRGDCCEIFIDATGDGRQYVEIQIAPTGAVTILNHILTAEAKSNRNFLLENSIIDRNLWTIPEFEIPGLKRAARIIRSTESPIWIADIAIPAATLLRRTGAKSLSPASIRANFIRIKQFPNDPRGNWSGQNWAPVLKGCPHLSPQGMGTLNLINIVRPALANPSKAQ